MKLEIYHNTLNENNDFQPVNDTSIHFNKSLPFYRPTPLIRLEEMARKIGAKEVFIKDESNRFKLNSFKPLGAGYALHELKKNSSHNLSNGVVATTAGNHGIGVAYFAREFDISCSIILPEFVSETRELYIKSLDANVIRTSFNYDHTTNWMKANFPNKLIISDTAWKGYEEIPTLIKKGYYVLFKELAEELRGHAKDLLIFLQGGVGTFASSCISYFRSLWDQFDRLRFAVVEPEKAACLMASAKNSTYTSIPVGYTKASCLACGDPNPLEIDNIINNTNYFIVCNDDVAEQGVQTLEKKNIDTSFTGAITTGVLEKLDASKLDISDETTIIVFNTGREI